MGALTMSTKTWKTGLVFIYWQLLMCLVWSPGVFGQTSPQGTFKIESETKPAPSPIEGTDVADFVVSTTDPKVREPLDDHADTTSVQYYISPDEKWIYEQIYSGHKMTSGQLFKRNEGLKFQAANKSQSLAEMAWRYFAKQERLKPDDVPYFQLFEGHFTEEGIIDFVAWSPDSGRLLVDLRAGDFGGERSRGIYKWYVYFNTKTQNLELTDYLRRLNKDAWKRWKNFGEEGAPIFAEAVSAEPLGELAPEAELRKKYGDADARLSKTYNEILSKIDKEQQGSLRDDQRHWLKARDAGAKFYKQSGGKSTSDQRYWQYMLDSTEAQLQHIEMDWKSQITEN
jgi:uncharacterized protein YecT (DUF1311 family)